MICNLLNSSFENCFLSTINHKFHNYTAKELKKLYAIKRMLSSKINELRVIAKKRNLDGYKGRSRKELENM